MYSVRQVEQIVGISRAALRRLIAGGLVSPRRGPRRALRFGFQDLVLLRLAKGLTDAGVPPRRIERALQRLRAELPEAPPLTGLRIVAVGDEVVVMDGAGQWRAQDGQFLLAFDAFEPGENLAHFRAAGPGNAAGRAGKSATDWFAEALALEDSDSARAIALYRRALAGGDEHSGVFVNLGRLLHAAGDLAEAQAAYDRGLELHPEEALLLFNGAVLAEDLGRCADAIALYERALAADPALEDAHYNLGLLWQSAGRPQEAVRHFNAYRRLTASADAVT